MLEYYLPQYLLEITPLIDARGNSRASTINTTTGGRVYQSRTPESVTWPYIVVGELTDVDIGQTADVDLIREVANYNVVVVGRSFNTIRQLYRDVLDALRMVRNQYIPSSIAASKIWTQCIIIQNPYQFEGKALDADQTPQLGYVIPIKAGYDP